jgi:hypothetical protein
MGVAQAGSIAARPGIPASRVAWTGRLLAPTLLDLFFLAVLAWSFMTSGTGWARLLWDGDTSLHTAIGRWILDHGQIPTRDPFSFTIPGAPWLAVEWGTGVLFAILKAALGLKGIVFVCGVTIGATIALMLRAVLAAGADLFVAVGLTLAANNVLLMHYHARPHVFGLLLFALAVWIVTEDRRLPTRWIWALPPLAALWANLHPGFVLLIAYLALIAAGYLFEPRHRGNAVRYAIAAAACTAAALLNPFGYRLYVEILGYFRAQGMTDLIQEFQAPTFRTGPQLWYLCFLLATLALLGPILRRRDYSSALVIVVLAYESLTSVRHSTVFILAVLPVLGQELTRIVSEVTARYPKKSVPGILAELSAERRPALMSASILPVVALAAIFLWTPEPAWPREVDRKLFPVDMASRHASELAGGRVFTPEQWADYLLLANYPRQRVFYDDRSVYGERMFRVAADLLNARPGSFRSLDRFGVRYVLIDPRSPLAAVLLAGPEWREVDRDSVAVLLKRQR